MKKIFNWTLGGFFRTLGRSLAFIGLGILFALICKNYDIKIGHLIGIDYVNAATITNWTTTQTRYWFDQAGTITNSGSWQTNPQTWSPTYPVARIQYRLTIPESFKTDSTYTFKVGWYSNPDSLGVETVYANFQGDDPTYANISCGNFTRDDNGYEVASCTVTPNTDIASGSYFYVAIHFYESYVTQLKSYIKGYTSQLGTNAVIEQQTGKIIDAIDDIFDNNRQNTTQIINNQNQNTQLQIESQQVCQDIDKKNIKSDNIYLSSNGNEGEDNTYGLTDYINIDKNTKIQVLTTLSQSRYTCFYNVNKEVISCVSNRDMTADTYLTIPTNSNYVRFSINKTYNKPTFRICRNGNQALTDSLNDDNISSSQAAAADFFGNFTTDTHGLTGIITAPLTSIQSLTSSTCSPLVLPLPFVNNNLTLPCMRPIYEQYFGSFMSLYDTITIGIIGYWVCVRIFSLVKDFKNPDHDEIEVVDL